MLDVLTPRGQESIRHEQRAYELFHARFKTYMLLPSPKARAADADGMVYDRASRELRAVVETKCRKMTGQQFEREFESRWLITQSKLDRCRSLAMSLRVPFVGLLYLIPDDALLVQKIYNSDGARATEIESRWTKTQATINGGEAVRLNAYVLVRAAPLAADHAEWLAQYDRYQATEVRK